MLKCLTTAIGLAKEDNACFTSVDAEKNYKLSNGELFIDQLEETRHILGTASMNCNSLYKMFADSRSNAINNFSEKIMQELGSRYTVRMQPYSGLIGQTRFDAPLSLTTNYAGSILQMKALKGATLRVTKLYLAINETRTVNINVYKAYLIGGRYEIQGEAITTISVDAAANHSTAYTLATELHLPLTDESAHLVNYLFLYDRSEGFQPMNVLASCGCNNQTYLEHWLIQGGITANDLNTLQQTFVNTGRTAHINGIVIEGTVSCSDLNFICDTYRSNPMVKLAIEHALLYQSASNLLKMILHSDSIDRFTLTKREQMAVDSKILHEKFKSRIPWISENIDMKSNTCYICNSNQNSSAPYRSTIIF